MTLCIEECYRLLFYQTQCSACVYSDRCHTGVSPLSYE